MTESYTRGNPTPQDLQSAFEGNDAARIGTLLGYWPILKDNLYDALGLSADGKRVSDQGLVGANLDRYRIAFDSLRLLNIEFLYLCCARVSQMMTRSDDELQRNAEVLENNVRMLSQAQTRTAA